jgi:protein SCO1
MMARIKPHLWVWISLLGLVALVLVGLGIWMNRPYTFRGSALEPAQPAPELNLTDQSGKNFQMSAVKGKVVLLFFGYTHCPDECPTTLAQFKQLHSDLGKQADQVQVVFITVDPLRDNPQQIGTYLKQFEPDDIGLTGSKTDLSNAWSAYGVDVEVPTDATVSTDYEVVHTNRIYMIDQDGRLRLTYAYGTPTEDMLADARALLRGG